MKWSMEFIRKRKKPILRKNKLEMYEIKGNITRRFKLGIQKGCKYISVFESSLKFKYKYLSEKTEEKMEYHAFCYRLSYKKKCYSS